MSVWPLPGQFVDLLEHPVRHQILYLQQFPPTFAR
jgi:hypothetical protein